MEDSIQTESHFSKLYKAFSADGFKVKKRAYTESGMLGIEAKHMTAADRDTGKMKTSYYLEGNPYERGYLLGLLAEPEISDMSVNFVDNIIFDFIGLDFLNVFPLLQKLLVSFIHDISRSTWESQPKHIRDEVNGILNGCKKSNPKTPVTLSRLSIMNVGIDVLCALVYTGSFLRKQVPQLAPKDIHLAMMCNAFSIFGAAASGGHFFARDFMFASGGVLQKNLAHIICLPSKQDKVPLNPHVSITAPGMIGSISAMNIKGVAAGLNMSPAANCDIDHVGINSMLLLRESILYGSSASDSAEVVKDAKRGVSWNYVFSDGVSDTACTVEAGASLNNIDFLSYPPASLRPYLPDDKFLSSHEPAPFKNGTMTRWYGAPFPDIYFKFNAGLFEYYKARYNPWIRLYKDAFLPDGFINRTIEEKNCPSNFYFAPQRTQQDVFITTNHFLLPHMRLCAMDPWVALITIGKVNDLQWRYDELNHQVRQELIKNGSINYKTAKHLADYLSPYGKFPEYYEDNPKSSDGKDIRIEGCTSLFDLKNLTVESHFGYYKDKWVKTTLPAYF
ncbi:MAG: hypothetical protein R2876_00570 [Eubacteriales bacterium]